MSKEFRYVGSDKLRFVSQKTNPAIPLVKSALLLDISNPPKVIDSTLWNMLMFHLTSTYKGISGLANKASAEFLPRINTVLLYDNLRKSMNLENIDNNFVIFHETIHNYIGTRNQELGMSADYLNSLIECSQRFGGFNTQDVERTIVHGSFNEGLCEWATIQSSKSSNQEGMRKQARFRHKIYHGNRNELNTSNLPYSLFIKFQRKGMERLITKYIDAIREGKTNQLQNSIHEFDLTAYTLGYFFAEKALRVLVKRKEDIPNAFNELIDNPPSTLCELSHPTEYALMLKKS